MQRNDGGGILGQHLDRQRERGPELIHERPEYELVHFLRHADDVGEAPVVGLGDQVDGAGARQRGASADVDADRTERGV